MIPEMILYLLKVNIALLLFYAGYYFILQRYTFHTLNRFYLLTALVYSALYPLIDLPKLLRSQELKEQIGTLAPDWQGSIVYIVNQAEHDSGRYWQALLLIFWVGVIVMSLRLIIQLISLLVLHAQSSSSTLAGFKFRKLSKTINPFSFWRTIYLNPECHDAAELRSILEHEQVHVKQLHTIDVLLAELSTIFYWFNPGVWLVKKAIKANLEYITDQEVINSGIDSKAYQYALLKSHMLPQNPMPVNNFHFLTIKKRIAMINKRPSNRINLSNYLLVLPAIMLLALILAAPKEALSRPDFVSRMIKQFPATSKILTEIPVGTNEQDTNSVRQLAALNEVVMETLTSVNRAGVGDTNKIEMSIHNISGNRHDLATVLGGISSGDTVKSEPVYFVDGVRVANGLNYVNPDSIETVEVFKVQGKATIFNLEGGHDVVNIKTKSFVRSKNLASQKTNAAPQPQKPITNIQINDPDVSVVIIDGKEVNKTAFKELRAADINNIEVLKGEAAVIKYGERSRKGVIVITTK